MSEIPACGFEVWFCQGGVAVFVVAGTALAGAVVVFFAFGGVVVFLLADHDRGCAVIVSLSG